jgi:heme exporter protein A
LRIEADNLACRRAGRRVFAGLSFALSEGEALIVTGRNGAGKSSLLAILAGRLRAAAGNIRISGADGRTLPECVHVVGHRDALKPALTAKENLAFARDILGDPAMPPREALAAVGLEHAAALPVAYLSAGQRRRVALARLLVARRPLWLLDEPAAALDAPAQRALTDMMRAHLTEGGLLIAATHQPLGLEGARELRLEGTTASTITANQGTCPDPSPSGEGGLGPSGPAFGRPEGKLEPSRVGASRQPRPEPAEPPPPHPLRGRPSPEGEGSDGFNSPGSNPSRPKAGSLPHAGRGKGVP